jgi:hypothetical protein
MAGSHTSPAISTGCLVRRRVPQSKLEIKLARIYGRKVHRVLNTSQKYTGSLGLAPLAIQLWEGRRRFVMRWRALDYQPLTYYRRDWTSASRYTIREEKFYRDGWFSADHFELVAPAFAQAPQARAEGLEEGEAHRQIGEVVHRDSVHTS